MLMWWLRRASPEIVTRDSDVPLALYDRLRRVAEVDLIVRFFDISTDFRVPTVFCILIGEEFSLLYHGRVMSPGSSNRVHQGS
jgi:ribosomal protein S12 methylthiotransferase accessory factor YcaO